MFWGNARKLLDDKIMSIFYDNVVAVIGEGYCSPKTSNNSNEKNEGKIN